MVRQYEPRGPHRVFGVVLLAVAVVVGACSASDAGDPAAVTVPTSDEVRTTAATASTTTTAPAVEGGPLGEVCPSTIAIQTDSLPGPAVGPLHELLGPDPMVDVTRQWVSAPLVRADGTTEDVVLEIRAGGPAVDFRNPIDLLVEDSGLLLAQASTAVALSSAAEKPTVGVVTLTDRSSDALIVDPATYPGVETVDAVRDAGIEVRHVTDEPFVLYLESTGSLSPGQLVAGFDGEPAGFVQSGGAISQQGDLLVEPLLLPALPQWGRPVVAIEAASAGWAVHDDGLVARPADVDDQGPCLGRLVPVIQEAIAAYVDDPVDTNELMGELRSQFAPLARQTPEMMDAGVGAGRDAGVFGDGANDTVGDFDVARLDAFLPDLAVALDVEAVGVDTLVTNRFIDPAVTSAG
jgi:hypothetical protein